MLISTAFDPHQRYILVQLCVTDARQKMRNCIALLDTGAPATEFSDEVLEYLGFLEKPKHEILLRSGLQTQKYGRIVLPHVEVCSRTMNDLEVYVSHFDKSWGIDALIGLDFFRQFCVTIDYQKACIATEPYKAV